MVYIRQKIKGDKLSKFINIPDDLKNKELEIIVQSISKPNNKFSKIYSSPVKVRMIDIPSRKDRNER